MFTTLTRRATTERLCTPNSSVYLRTLSPGRVETIDPAGFIARVVGARQPSRLPFLLPASADHLSLEDRVEQVLRGIPVAFEPRVRFIGKRGQGAKCDFAIIGRDHPKIVVEAKGFEATGSKLTDFLGDVLKIGQVKEYHTYFFLVTDGRGWLNRESDLKRLIEYHNEGLVDMIYTQARLEDFARHVKAIIENE